MKMKYIVVLICMLLISTAILPVSGTVLMERTPISTSLGDTLYVGGSGPGNYSTIQSAINDASDGDTVFVYDDSSPYVENLVVDKSIELIGENRHTTVIDGNEKEDADVILIKADGVTVQGFTVQNSSYDNGIEIISHNNIIKDNILTDNKMGIQLGEIPFIYSNNSIIEGNIITNNNFAGIYFAWAFNNIISGNIISSNKYHGVFITYDSGNNLVIFNNISSHEQVGVFINNANNNTIQRNTIIDNKWGVSISYSSQNKVLENNIFNNEKNAMVDAYTVGLLRFRWFDHTWDGNYWGRFRLIPKLIPGFCLFIILNFPFFYFNINIFDHNLFLFIPVFKFDWHPAREPYDIY